MKLSVNKPNSATAPVSLPDPPRKRRSLFGRIASGSGWLATGPVDWAGVRRIQHGWSLIGDLVGLLRAGPTKDARFKTEEHGEFDLRASAFSYGMLVHEFEALLWARRLQTARIAYTTFALAWLFLGLWAWRVLTLPWTATRILPALYFLPFCVVFFLIAANNALLNFQIRTRRRASWGDYMATSERFWPH